MIRRRSVPSGTRRRVAAGLLAAAALAGCSATSDASTAAGTVSPGSAAPDVADAAAGSSSDTSTETDGEDTEGAIDPTSDLGAVGTLSSAVVHTISIEFDPAEYADMIATYTATDDKEWIEATITIDGHTYEQVGIRLKGNSSLRGVSADADPASLPWLIKLDKYVDDQSLDGLTDLVVRANSTTTALNEAVALELLELAGLASQDAIATSFSVNGAEPVFRLVIDHPDDVWMAEVLDASGALYKAESTGDYSYRGDEPETYDEVFDQEAGDDNADLSPLIEFLRFVNESDDADFVDELDRWLDIDSFATYLAMEDLIDNFDDIDGPGNNSYLYWDVDTGRFTVVPWDHNLAFGVRNGDAGTPGDDMGGGPPAGGPAPDRPAGQLPGDARRGPGEGSNALVERFTANPEWAQLVETRTDELRTALYDGGVAADVLEQWVEVISSSGMVDPATIADEADRIAAVLSG